MIGSLVAKLNPWVKTSSVSALEDHDPSAEDHNLHQTLQWFPLPKNFHDSLTKGAFSLNYPPE